MAAPVITPCAWMMHTEPNPSGLCTFALFYEHEKALQAATHHRGIVSGLALITPELQRLVEAGANALQAQADMAAITGRDGGGA